MISMKNLKKKKMRFSRKIKKKKLNANSLKN